MITFKRVKLLRTTGDDVGLREVIPLLRGGIVEIIKEETGWDKVKLENKIGMGLKVKVLVLTIFALRETEREVFIPSRSSVAVDISDITGLFLKTIFVVSTTEIPVTGFPDPFPPETMLDSKYINTPF